MKYPIIIFDLDGTLLNTLDDLMDAVNHVLAAHSYPLRSYEEIRQAVGNGVGLLMERSTPAGLSQSEQDQLLSEFKAYYSEHLQDKTRPYDGIYELLAELKRRGHQLSIVSNKLDSAVQELTKQYFAEYITIAVGESEHIQRKPAPDMALEALRQLGADKSEAVYIGDSEVDFATAENAGLPCISVTWGFRDKAYLTGLGAKTFAHLPADILALV